MSEMPKIPVGHLSRDERKLVAGIIASRGKNAGRLRASKPGSCPAVQYVWRMVAFYTSPKRRHSHFPVMAEYWLGEDDNRDDLDRVVDKVVDAMPLDDLNGVRLWAKALGGTRV